MDKISGVRLIAMLAFAGTTANAQYDPAEDLPGSDRPRFGRSLFDYVMLSDDGTRFDVPFPIEALVARVKARTGLDPRVTLIPKGRSLQREHADFKNPRLVFAIDDDPVPAAGDLGPKLKDRLYFAYAEKSNQLEALSFNGASGRFEFQIVRDYKEGGARNLLYANRTLCVKCHHNGGPIFSPNPWPETNGSTQSEKKIADLITQARGSAAPYHGAEIQTPLDIPYKIDSAVERVKDLLPRLKLWTEGCGGDTDGAVQCRGMVLRLGLDGFLRSSEVWRNSAEVRDLMPVIQRNLETRLRGGIKVPNHTLVTYFPLRDTPGTSDGFRDLSGLSADESDVIRRMLANSQVPQDKDPLFQFLASTEQLNMSSPCSGTCGISGIRNFFSRPDRQLLLTASGRDVEKVATAVGDMTTKMDGSLANRPIRRAVIMKALLVRLGSPAPKGGWEDDVPDMPLPAFDSVEPPKDDLPLTLIKSYCLPCHQDLPGRKSFLIGSDAEVVAKIKVAAPAMIKRLNWEVPQPGFAQMPPRDANEDSQRTRLAAHPEHRQAIVDWIKSL